MNSEEVKPVIPKPWPLCKTLDLWTKSTDYLVSVARQVCVQFSRFDVPHLQSAVTAAADQQATVCWPWHLVHRPDVTPQWIQISGKQRQKPFNSPSQGTTNHADVFDCARYIWRNCLGCCHVQTSKKCQHWWDLSASQCTPMGVHYESGARPVTGNRGRIKYHISFIFIY